MRNPRADATAAAALGRLRRPVGARPRAHARRRDRAAGCQPAHPAPAAGRHDHARGRVGDPSSGWMAPRAWRLVGTAQIWLLLIGPPAVWTLVIPYIAWLVVRHRPWRSFVTVLFPLATGILVPQLAHEYQFQPDRAADRPGRRGRIGVDRERMIGRRAPPANTAARTSRYPANPRNTSGNLDPHDGHRSQIDTGGRNGDCNGLQPSVRQERLRTCTAAGADRRAAADHDRAAAAGPVLARRPPVRSRPSA